MSHGDNTWLWIGGGLAVIAYFAYQQQQSGSGATAAGIPFYSTTPTPYSIYPEWSYTAPTSMATTPSQKASTASVPTSYFTSVQQAELTALAAQGAGAFPGPTAMLGDTQLGF